MKLNDAQLKAVETIDRNVAVNAGAGTGKTKVLTERYLYLLEHGDLVKGSEIESIVAITFTNKATQEMVDRIRQEIKKNIPRGSKWRRFYRDLERANISTIHGFCAKILRENPMEAKVDPYFEVLDEIMSSQLLIESITDVLNTSLERDEYTLKMMTSLNLNRVDNIVDDISSLYNSVRTVGVSFEKVKEDTISYLGALEIKRGDLEEIKDLVQYLIGKARKGSKLKKLEENRLWMDFLEDKYDDEDIYSYLEFIGQSLGTMKNEEETLDRVNMLLDSILATRDKEYMWLYDHLTDLLIEIDRTYSLKKRQLGGLDYDDLQNLLLDLLDNKVILEKYQSKYRYFMIDEFQDTNELQKKIFYKLASVDKDLDRENLFIVGDPKQSIYGFRGANIDVFYRVIEDITRDNRGESITLDMNYRSFNTILNFVNDLFSKIMEFKYDALHFNKRSENNIDIEILEDDEERTAEEASLYEAQAIAKRIKSLVSSGQYRYKDIALLFRASTRNHIYEQALKNYNIPYYNSSSKRFFNRQEILDILNGLKAISNPYDHIAAIGFLRSPMVGLKDTSIYWLLKYLDRSLYHTLLNEKDNSLFSRDEKEKIEEAANLLGYFYKVKNLYSVGEILDLLLEKTLFMESSLLKLEGKQIIANIYKFTEMTNDYFSENNSSLEDYIDYLEKIKASPESEGVIQSEEEDLVKLITIHSSKGLQFPVVIIPEMGKKSGGFPPKMLYNKDFGIGIKTEDSDGIYKEINQINKLKEDEESERVLYVAVTRAEEMLIFGAYGGNYGFKRLINGILPENQIRRIADLDLDKEITQPVKAIDELLERLENLEKSTQVELPLLYPIESFNTRDFASYNISQYQKFKQCKKKFYLEYYWGLNSKIDSEDESYNKGEEEAQFQVEESSYLASATKGNIIHRFTELYRNSMDREELIKDISTSYGVDYTEELERELKIYIDNYLKSYNEDYDQIYSERLFHIKVGNKYIRGYIDRIVIRDGEIEIIDYKTNQVRNINHLINFYEPQLQLYAYAVERIFKKKVSKASISFLENGQKVDIDISQESLIKNYNRIADFIEFVESHKDMESYGEASQCHDHCLYKGFCK